MENYPRIALALWEGKYLPRYCKDILINNSYVFDKIYFISNLDDLDMLDGIHHLDSQPFREYIESMTYKGIGAAALSDVISYAPKMILEKVYDIRVDRIMVIDTDYLVYNKLMITRLFDVYSRSFISREKSTYIRNYGELFYNPCMSFVVDDMYELLPKWIDAVKADHGYGSGSSKMLMQNQGILDSKYQMPSGIKTEVYRSTDPHHIYMKDDVIGVHIEASTYFRYLLENNEEYNDLKITRSVLHPNKYSVIPIKSFDGKIVNNARFEEEDSSPSDE